MNEGNTAAQLVVHSTSNVKVATHQSNRQSGSILSFFGQKHPSMNKCQVNVNILTSDAEPETWLTPRSDRPRSYRGLQF